MIHRPRLYATLNRWPTHRLVLVRAAAGYGKSSLVSLWSSRNATTAAWLLLDQSDADPVQFVRYIAAALDPGPPALEAVTSILQDLQPDATRALTSLLAALSPVDPVEDGAPLLLILDDYHRARSPEIDELLGLMLERAPDRLHLMILTRDLPTFPLARLMVTGSMLELTSTDLRFDQREVAHFLRTNDLEPLTQSQMSQVMSRSEGWVAGLKMARLSLVDHKDPDQFLRHLHGASQWQSEYLAVEVLSKQSPEMREFLLQTAILDRLNGRLCTAVTDTPKATALLKKAYSAGLFLIPLDNRQTWYRYQHLFQEMLRLQLVETHSETEVRRLHQRAATWYETEGQHSEAFAHYRAAGDRAAAAVCLEHPVRAAITVYDLHTAGTLLQKLPPDELELYPSLLVLDAWRHYQLTDADVITSSERAARALERVDATNPALPRLEAELAICLAGSAFMQRQMDAVDDYARRAEEQIHLLDDSRKAALWALRAQQAMQQGWWEKSEAYSRQAIATYLLGNDRAGAISQRSEMAFMMLYTGRGAAAARELEETVGAYPPPQSNYVLRVVQYTHVEAAEVYYWLNNQERMRHHAQKAAEIGAFLGVELSVTMGSQYLDLYRLSNPDYRMPDYAQPRVLARGANGMFPFNTPVEILYQIRAGQIDNAMMLAESFNLSAESDPTAVTPSRLVMYVEARVAAGKDLRELDNLVGGGLKRFNDGKFVLFLGRLQAIEAWRQLRLEDEESARQMLAAAVETASQSGLSRAILDIPDLRPLLAELDHPRAAVLASLMEPDTTSSRIGPGTLTRAELRVLGLLVVDMRYEDIAEQLSISPHTVRSHIKNIYRKLDVNRRMAAIETARQAGLID